MSDEEFCELFQRLIEKYELDPETAARLLQQILEILYPDRVMDDGE